MMRYFYRTFLVILLFSIVETEVIGKDFTKKEQQLIEKYKPFLTDGSIVEGISKFFILEKIDTVFVAKIINPDKLVITHEIEYWNYLRVVRHGVCKEWYDNGNIWKKGNYVYGKKQGLWRYYSHSENGKLQRAGMFVNDKKEGIWTFQSEDIKEITRYKNGKKEGLFERYDLDNRLLKKVFYKAGEIDSIIFENTYLNEKAPKFRKGYKEYERLLRKISSSVSYPNEAQHKGIEGKVVVEFSVEKDGRIGEVIVLRGVCDALEKQVVKKLKKLPKFEKPGMKEGKPVRCWFHLPLRFRLRN